MTTMLLPCIPLIIKKRVTLHTRNSHHYAKNLAGADGHHNVDVNTVHYIRHVPAVNAK
jgi:hypothetical protein